MLLMRINKNALKNGHYFYDLFICCDRKMFSPLNLLQKDFLGAKATTMKLPKRELLLSAKLWRRTRRCSHCTFMVSVQLRSV
jgi:hypothetical protein